MGREKGKSGGKGRERRKKRRGREGDSSVSKVLDMKASFVAQNLYLKSWAW